MTLDGTNTWLLHVPGSRKCIVIDPGPDEKGHFEAIIAAAELRDAEIGAILLTHRHSDHSAGAKSLAERTKSYVRAADPEFRLGAEGLETGDVIVVDQTELRVISTPGHSSDSVSFLMTHDNSMLTGDTVLGRGTAVISAPDGNVGAYLDSLKRMRDAVAQNAVGLLLPGHGPCLDAPDDILNGYYEHRVARLEEVRVATTIGLRTSEEVLDQVYATTPEKLRPAALQSVKAQLLHLQGLGQFTTDEDLTSPPTKTLDVEY
ncbi:MAG: MBL fold metallo-hydrolase [Actinomycetota bacterium]|nr:MBL fold metallo-hydrolase [Actinomycetota bacterium]MDP2287560.1 MBL fold metallo-hydrolase [Actinomycetota bacterium]